MNAKRHADLARLLIAACGGQERAAAHCRLSQSSLQRFTDRKTGKFMPADVIADLQELCGDPIYSRAMTEGPPPSLEALCLLTESFQTTEVAAKFQTLVRTALEDDKISHAEGLMIDAALVQIEDQVRELRAARERATT